MICAVVAERSVATCLEALKDLSFAEIRLDAMDEPPRDLGPIFSGASALVATCRPGRLSDGERLNLLTASVEAGASFVDVELDSDREYRETIVGKCRSKGCRVIISHHDYEKTPGREELVRIIAACFRSGADITKIACRVNSNKDAARLMGLLDSDLPLVVIGMGPQGAITRIVAPLLGSPFTYAALEKGREVVEGQLDRHTIRTAFDFLGELSGGKD